MAITTKVKTFRYQANGFDLDLSYITDRVLVMSTPVSKRIKGFRNSIDDVSSLFNQLYQNKYKIFNLAPELKFDVSKFEGQVAHYACDVTKPPLLTTIQAFVNDLQSFLDKDPRNVAVICCSNGVERSGMMVCSYLLHCQKCKSPSEAVQLFSDRRLLGDVTAIEQPSYVRYLLMFHALLQPEHSLNVAEPKSFCLEFIRMNTIPNYKVMGGCDPWFAIFQRGKRIFFSQPLKGKKGNEAVRFNCHNVSISGDISIDFYHKNLSKRMFSVSFNTAFVRQGILPTESKDNKVLKFPRRDVDDAYRDHDNKHFYPNFRLDLYMKTSQEYLVQSLSNYSQDRQKSSSNYELDDDEETFSQGSSLYFEKTCAGCKDAIFFSDLSLSTSTRSYHWNCLNCEKCNKSIKEESYAVVKDDKILCERCETTAFFPKCTKCSLPIKDKVFGDAPGLDIDLRWHGDCFRCQSCNAHLIYSKYIIDDGEPYCYACGIKPEVIHRPRESTVSGTSQKKNFLVKLLNGEVDQRAKKGKLNQVETGWLMDWAINDDRENVNLAAVRALAYTAYPVEIIPGMRKHILGPGLLEYLVYYASRGLLTIHNEIDFKEIELLNELGRGASAVVYKGRWKGKDVAVKVFDKDNICFDVAEIRREVSFICVLAHEAIVKCFGACTTGETMAIVSEFMGKGSLRDMLERKELQSLSTKVKFAREIARGMAHLQACKIIHRDLKPENLMINDEMQCKLIDFGTTKVVQKLDKRMTYAVGTPSYIAPEGFKSDSQYSEMSDVYSFGIICWELLTEERPYMDLQVFEIPDKVLSGHRPPIPAHSDKQFAQLIVKCWDEDPQKRPSFRDIDVMLAKISEEDEMPGSFAETSTLYFTSEADRVRFVNCNVNELVNFTVEAHDEWGNRRTCGGDTITAFLVDENNNKQVCEVTDCKDGTYTSTYRADKPGKFALTIKLNDQDIFGSPFDIQAKEAAPPVKLQETVLNDCMRCGNPIAGEFMTLRQFRFHVGCFICSVCQKHIEGIGGFRDGRLYCEADFKAQFAKKCATCGEYLEGKLYAAFGKYFHPNCFTCAGCHQPLQDGQFYEKDGNPTCAQCSQKFSKLAPTSTRTQTLLGVHKGDKGQTVDILFNGILGIEKKSYAIEPNTVTKDVFRMICDDLKLADWKKYWLFALHHNGIEYVALDENTNFLQGSGVKYVFKHRLGHSRSAKILEVKLWRTAKQQRIASAKRILTLSSARLPLSESQGE